VTFERGSYEVWARCTDPPTRWHRDLFGLSETRAHTECAHKQAAAARFETSMEFEVREAAS
jgi:hypothetical protein